MSWIIGNISRYRDKPQPAGAVYVGRPRRGDPPSPLANPFSTEPNPGNSVIVVPDPIRAYRHWLHEQVRDQTSPQFLELVRLSLLPDGMLLCWCHPRPCHAQVISRAIDWLRTQPLTIKCLTLTQPWASLMAIGAKTIETRSWKVPVDSWGLIGIHAGKGLADMTEFDFAELCNRDPFATALAHGGYMDARELPRGAILAIANIAWIKPTTFENPPEEPERSFGNYAPGRYAWHIDHVMPLPRPVLARGYQSLWPYTLSPEERMPQAPPTIFDNPGVQRWIETGR